MKGNFIADDLARLGAKPALVGPEPMVRICENLIKNKFGDLFAKAYH